jgi:hypothetical protein
MEAPDHDLLIERMDRLEHQVRRWRLAAGVPLGILLLAGVLGAKPAKEIRTESLIIQDKAGRSRAAFVVSPEGTVIMGLIDGSRRTRASLFVYEDGKAGLSLADESAKPRVQLELSGGAVGDASVRVNDADEKPRGELRVDADGAPSLQISDGEGKPLFRAP